MTHQFQKTWLKVNAILIGAFGPLLFLASAGATEPARFSLDFLSWPLDGLQQYSDGTLRFLSALSGGFLMGWGTTIWLLSNYLYDKEPVLVKRAVVLGLLTWFTFDSAGSILSGNASNALFSIVVLAIGVGPLLLPAKKLEQRPKTRI